MPIEIKYDQKRNVLDISVSGNPDFDEITSTFQIITSSSDYPPDTNAIWDIRNSDFSNADFQFVNKLVKIRSRFTERGKCRSAMIASTNVHYGLSRMFEMLSERKMQHQLMVFRDYEEGEKWVLENEQI